jgi:hypothetical protein
MPWSAAGSSMPAIARSTMRRSLRMARRRSPSAQIARASSARLSWRWGAGCRLQAQVPARPFLAPVFEQYAQPDQISRRFLERIAAQQLRGDFGHF